MIIAAAEAWLPQQEFETAAVHCPGCAYWPWGGARINRSLIDLGIWDEQKWSTSEKEHIEL